jgi:hypothetical protein
MARQPGSKPPKGVPAHVWKEHVDEVEDYLTALWAALCKLHGIDVREHPYTRGK